MARLNFYFLVIFKKTKRRLKMYNGALLIMRSITERYILVW